MAYRIPSNDKFVNGLKKSPDNARTSEINHPNALFEKNHERKTSSREEIRVEEVRENSEAWFLEKVFDILRHYGIPICGYIVSLIFSFLMGLTWSYLSEKRKEQREEETLASRVPSPDYGFDFY